ncbi:MAG TPA: glycosyltransferase family protein [Chitinophagales bacterium]|nr:glycosyltransferase family protein [Chitinophagales bacterium]
MNILTIIQARRGSSRLPDKVLLPLAGKPLLARMAERVLAARNAGTVVVATTTEAQDDVIAGLCERENLTCFRGHPTDLLDRHYQAAVWWMQSSDNPDIAVVKIPSDCPLIDPQVIDRVIGFFIDNAGKYDYVSNLHPATYPDGNDVEVMTFRALEDAWKNAGRPLEREHTTPYIWDNPEKFRIGNVAWETGKDFSMSHRFSIDYKEDYDFIKTVYDELYPQHPLFGLDNILALLDKRHDIFAINSKFAGVNWYRHHLDELKTIRPEHTRILKP